MGPRGGKYYTCAICGKAFPPSNVQVDHVDPVIPVDRAATDMSWDELINRVFTTEDNLQVICKPDHKKKSALENKERRMNR
jgi:5-methylcytosine-specific restriction endonuclease McrA